MTYEEWREINYPDWRLVTCNGWNDPNEGWHYEYRKQYPNWKELNQPKKSSETNLKINQKGAGDNDLDILIKTIANNKKIQTVDIPVDIIQAAEKVSLWFEEKGIRIWSLGNIQSRR